MIGIALCLVVAESFGFATLHTGRLSAMLTTGATLLASREAKQAVSSEGGGSTNGKEN